MEIYQEVLRDPLPADWASDPMESLAVLVTPHPLPYEHWFKAALARKDPGPAIEISDRMKRHRFFTSLPYGGRLESLRWVLEAPDDVLDKASKLHRQDLLTRYPAYKDLRQQAHALHDRLIAMPLATEDQEPSKEQSQELAQLAAVSQRQEVDPPRDGGAPGAGRADLPAAARTGRHPEIAPQGTRPVDLRGHQRRVDLRIPA